MKQQGIYKIRNLVNQKFYVGSSNNVYERFRAHKKLLRGNRHHSPHLQAAWNKYGSDCFVFEIIAHVVAVEDLFTAENGWLQQWAGKSECYNAGRSAEAPMRGRTGAASPNFGVPVPLERKAAISLALKAYYAGDPANHPRVGKTHSEETKAQIKAAKLANPTTHWLGKERSEETKAKIGDAQRGVAKGPRTFTPDGLERARANMKRHAVVQVVKAFDSVLAKVPAEVQDRYDFSNAVYVGALIRITGVVCPQHGEFSNYAARFRKGWGCASCGAVLRAASKSAQMVSAWGDTDQRAEMLAARKKPVALPTATVV